MKRFASAFVLLIALAISAHAGTIRDGVLTVEDPATGELRPFFPVGSWMSMPVEHVAQLGFNIAFLVSPGSDSAVAAFRPLMRQFAEHDIQMIPYISYGGGGVTPWPPERVRAAAQLATEPNLLAWYVGDDIGMQHLPGIRQTVDILREETPDIPTVADYIAEKTPEAKTVFTEYIDIRCQYEYPIFQHSMSWYSDWFDDQREFVGDPLWTWIQCFQWGNQIRPINVGQRNGAGPVPDPDQVRVMSYLGLNRGLRGLLFFSHWSFLRLPELAGEVALIAREVRMFNDHLAAGAPTYNLPTSEPGLRATAMTHNGSALLSTVLLRPEYHRWVDEGFVRNVTIDAPWSGGDTPRALLVAAPDLVECAVERIAPDQVRITVPEFELAGFILISSDEDEIARVERDMVALPAKLDRVMATAAASQVRKVNGLMWHAGWENHGHRGPNPVLSASRRVDSCMVATLDGRYDDALRMWRLALRDGRAMMDSLMRFVEARREVIPPQDHRYLRTPYAVRAIPNYMNAVSPEDPWHYVTEFDLTGPFPLEWDGTWFIRESDGRDLPTLPPGFNRAYAPESDSYGPYETVDGIAGWRGGHADVSALLDLVPSFRTTDNVVCYARTHIVAPREMDARISLGSNDGAKMWINGEEVFNRNDGRDALPHQDEIPVHLNAGPNEVLVKVSNLGGWGWKLYLSVWDPDRELEYRTAVQRPE